MGMTSRAQTGAMAHLSGLYAEDQVAQAYRRHGYAVLAQRWRAPKVTAGCADLDGMGGRNAGELDIVAQKDGEIVFVEVKRAETHASAATRVSPRQSQRILRAAQAYLAQMRAGIDTFCRHDIALVDAQGRIEILQNTLWA